MDARTAIKTLVDDYINENPRARNHTTISRDTGIPVSTVRRAAMGECALNNNYARSLLRLIKGSDEQSFKVLAEISDYAEYAQRQLALLYSEKGKKVEDAKSKVARYVASEKYADVIAHMEPYTTKEFIQKKYGEKGINALDDLIEDGIVRDNNGKYSMEPFHVADYKAAQKIVANYASFFYRDPNALERSFWSQSALKKVSYEKLLKAIDLVIKTAAEEDTESNSDGDIKMMMGLYIGKVGE